jgi:tRNA(Ile)-lysidine synthase
LLQVSRAEVRAWLTTIGQDWREDATNADLARTRSRLRHDLLPRLAAEYNPKIVEALVRLGWLVRGSNRAAEAWWQEHTEAVVLAIESETIRLRREPLAALPRIVRAELLRVCWRRAGWSEQPMGAARWLRLADLILHGKCRASIGGGIDARTHGEIFQLTRARVAATSLPPEVTLPIPGEAVWGAFRLVAEIADEAKPMSLSPGSVERIDLARLDLDPSTPALRVRSPRDGDRFEPLGLDGHTTALSDFLRGRGLARERRRSVPLVCDRTGIVWVVGHRITHRVRRTPATRSVLVLRSEPVASANREGGESGE